MKVLIISHNPISTNNNMGKTLLSLFSDFDKEELCQLYVHPATPDIVTCNSYYRVTDREILKSLYSFKSAGRKLEEWEVVAERNSSNISVMQRNPNNDRPSRRLLRDIMWKMSHWYTKALRTWLDEEQPTCIFLAPGYAKFIYDIALKIADEYKLPIISYICDDYYFVKEPKEILGKIQFNLLKKKIRQLFRDTKYLVVINEKLKTLYSREFGVKTTVIMTGFDVKTFDEYKDYRKNKKKSDTDISISYFGNITCNRNVSLAGVGRAVEQINKENHKNHKLKIYTSENDVEKLKVFEGIESIKLGGFVSGMEFKKEFYSSDILLHVEAFDENSVELVKNSISTKVAELLWSEIPILAYGPGNVAAIEYLINNEVAFVISKQSELVSKLSDFLSNISAYERFSENAIKLARENHNSQRNSNELKIICDMVLQ